MTKSALRVRERERKRAGRGARIPVLLRERLSRGAIGGNAGCERESHRRPGDQTDPLAKTEDGIEHDARRALTARSPSSAAGRLVSRPRPMKRARSVSHSTGPCDRPSRLRTCIAHDRRVLRIARAPMAEQRGAVGEVLGFEKQLAERRMRQIIGRRRQHDLRVAGDVDLANSRALVDDRHAPHFDVVFRRDGDVELRGDLVVVPAERRPLRPELDDVVVRFRGRRMIGGRPHGAASHVAQVDELTARIPRRRRGATSSRRARRQKLAPPPPFVTIGGVVAVRQELGVRKHRVRRSVLPHRDSRRRGDDAHFVEGPWLNRRCVTRHALLEQQFGGLHARLRMKALHHADRPEARWRWRPASCRRDGPGTCGRPCRPPGVPREAPARRRRFRAPCSRWRQRIRSRPRDRQRSAAADWRRSCPGSIIAASAVAYGATTSSSPSPRFRPRPGTPKALY